MLAAAVVLLGSDGAELPDGAVLPVVAVLLVQRLAVAEGRAHLAHKLLPLLPLRLLLLPQVVVESEVPLHRQGRRLFSAAMARSSPPTVQPTYERAPSIR